MESRVPMFLNLLAIKSISKKQMYSVLQNGCEMYMSPIQDTNSAYVRGVVTGTISLNHSYFWSTPCIVCQMIRSESDSGAVHYKLEDWRYFKFW